MRIVTLVAGACVLGACNQMPNTTYPVNSIPPFNSATIISSKAGLLAVDIAKIPGAICIPVVRDGKDRCEAEGFLPAPLRANGATIEVVTSTNTTPQYHSLINKQYNAGANVPFVSATVSDDVLDEVTATILATAKFSDQSPGYGYPGDGAVAQRVGNRESLGYVYWIASANIISVNVRQYAKVSSVANVTVTGVGLNGKTYNGSERDSQEIWIGVDARRVPVPSAGVPLGAAATVAPPRPWTIDSMPANFLVNPQTAR